MALKYLKNTETNIHNFIIITGDFNIRDSIWDSNFSFHSSYSNILLDIADLFFLAISKPLENFPTRFSDNDYNANLVLDLVFLCPSSPEFNCYCIHPEWRLLSDHAPITIDMPICKERILHTWQSLVKGSNKEKKIHWKPHSNH